MYNVSTYNSRMVYICIMCRGLDAALGHQGAAISSANGHPQCPHLSLSGATTRNPRNITPLDFAESAILILQNQLHVIIM